MQNIGRLLSLMTTAWPKVHIGIVPPTAFLQILIYRTLTKILPQKNVTYPLRYYKQLSVCIVLKASEARSRPLPEFFCYWFTTPQHLLVPLIQAVSSVVTVRLFDLMNKDKPLASRSSTSSLFA